MSKQFFTTLFLLTIFNVAFAQQPGSYPKVTGYFSIVQPLTTYTNGHFASNFGNVYVVGFPFD
jgi:hypothetical protein